MTGLAPSSRGTPSLSRANSGPALSICVGGEEVGRLAESGLDVLAVERKLIGGECLLGMHPFFNRDS